MAPERGSETETLSERIDKFKTQLPFTLTLDRELEASFQSNRSASRAMQAFWASLIAIVGYNLLFVGNVIGGQLLPALTGRAVAIDLAVVTAPCVCVMELLRRNRVAWRHDLLLLAAYGFVILGSVLINHCMTEESRIFDTMSQLLIAIACNIAIPLSFWAAALGSVFFVVAEAVSSAFGGDMPLEAQSTIALVNAVGAALTLVANYRFERAERTQYLNLLRENLRNHDIVRANDILSVQSRTDFLTGVLNRRAFDENFYEAFRSCRAEGRPLSVLLADIDHFKAYNDRFGHLEGDKCLIAVARAIAAAVEPGAGFAGRFGGEEFAVVLHGPGFESVPLLTERIRSALTALAIAHPGSRSGYVTLSLGVATLNPSCPESPEDLLLRADAALYRAKRKGRDCAEFDLKVVNN